MLVNRERKVQRKKKLVICRKIKCNDFREVEK